MDIASEFVTKYIYGKIHDIETYPVKSYKTRVQELVQKHYKLIPEYQDTAEQVSASGNIETYKAGLYIQ